MAAIGEMVGVIVVCGFFLKKFNDLTVIHIQWGVLRLEFARNQNESEPQATKDPKRRALRQVQANSDR